MAKRVTPAQLRNMIRQAEQKQRRAVQAYNREVDKFNRGQKQAVQDYNREVDKFNKGQKRAVDDYNREARAHNARVRANRRRLQAEVQKMSRQSATTHTVTYRRSFAVMQQTSVQVEAAGASDDLLELVDGEAANSAGVLNALLAEPAGVENDATQAELEELQRTSLTVELDALPEDLQKRWAGALFALNPRNPEAGRHFCTSAREILITVVESGASDAEVIAADPDCRLPDGRVSRRSKITHCLARKNLQGESLASMIEADVNNVLDLFGIVNAGTHGKAETYDIAALTAIKQRVEDAIRFLHLLLT